MSATVNSAEHRLQLTEVIDALVADGVVAAEVGDAFKQERRYFRGDAHPLIPIADQRWKSLQPPHRTLTLEELTQWLARWSGLTYMHVDPLKINFTAITEVMSSKRSRWCSKKSAWCKTIPRTWSKNCTQGSLWVAIR